MDPIASIKKNPPYRPVEITGLVPGFSHVSTDERCIIACQLNVRPVPAWVEKLRFIHQEQGFQDRFDLLIRDGTIEEKDKERALFDATIGPAILYIESRIADAPVAVRRADELVGTTNVVFEVENRPRHAAQEGLEKILHMWDKERKARARESAADRTGG